MNTRRLIVALALAASTSLAVFASPASAGDDWKNWHPDYRSAQELLTTYGAEYVADIAQKYGLPASFTAKQYGAAMAEDFIARLRNDYQLGPDFTSAQLSYNAGASEVAEKIQYYHLPTHFTEAQFKTARLLKHIQDKLKYHPGLSYPFSSDDFIRVHGADDALEVAQKYQLPTAWTYADLFAAAGPEEAASVRQEYHFGKTDTHDQIAHAMGVKALAWFTDEENLPATFTADQLAKLAPAFTQYDELAKLPSVSDQDLVTYYGAQTVKFITAGLDHYGLKETFTEADLRAAVAARAIDDMQERYDLNADFTSDDIARAIGLSKVASVRRDLGLRPDFSAAEYKSAWEKHESTVRPYYYY
jgi:hypothetical protein